VGDNGKEIGIKGKKEIKAILDISPITSKPFPISRSPER
jgi:hypothetical protein